MGSIVGIMTTERKLIKVYLNVKKNVEGQIMMQTCENLCYEIE